jgi:hypothetical protein
MEAICSSETSVHTITTFCHIQEDGILQEFHLFSRKSTVGYINDISGTRRQTYLTNKIIYWRGTGTFSNPYQRIWNVVSVREFSVGSCQVPGHDQILVSITATKALTPTQ